MALNFFRAQTHPDFERFDQLVARYRDELNEDYCFQAYPAEQKEYGHKDIYLFLASKAGTPCGCVGFWPTQSADRVEMKRLYVLPQYRQHKIGQALLDFCLTFLQQDNIVSIELETLKRLKAARQLYLKRGFHPLPCNNDGQRSDVIKMQKALKK